MSRPGSINYLKFSPYQLSSNSQRLLSFGPHWFLIRVITSIINLTTFGNQKNIYFSSENMVSNGWFRMYLNQEQQFFLENSKSFELYPIENLHKISHLKSLENQDCYVYASSDWNPPAGAQIISRVTNTLFRVKNLTVNKEVKNDNRVLTIKPIPRKKLNNRYNSGFLQTHHQRSVYDHNIFAPIRSLHNIGLDGTGQIINIVDTGVDAYNAMFYDPENPLPSISGVTNPNHRKIIRIEKYADDLDYYCGHGTHVAGIAAGNAFCTKDKCGISQYNGIASGAKIYFSDIGYSSVSGDLSEEFDLSEQATLLSQFGSYISSNSWSYDSPIKEDMFIYDQSAYNNPYLLYLFAAGNDYSYFSINSPSCAKNVVSVGATNAVSSSKAEYALYSVVIEGDSVSVEGTEISNQIIRLGGIAKTMNYITDRTVVNYTKEMTDYTDKITILKLEPFASSSDACAAYNDAVKKGTTAVIFSRNPGLNCGPYGVVTIEVPDESFEQLMTINKASILPYAGTDDEGLPKVAGLSSKGPSDNALSKPDFAVPGYQVISAKSHGVSSRPTDSVDFNGNLVQMSGTSMATPAGAGIATIVRQFLVDGFYPGLKKNSGDSIKPTSSLIRSMLVNSAIKPGDSSTEKSGPEFETGFGIPCLERVFGFKGAGLRLIDDVEMKSQSHHVYHVKLDSNSVDLTVTMTYIDPPLSPDNSALFFADLDLVVKSPNGKFYVGNGVSNLADSDSFSNTERVIVDKNEIGQNGGDFEIHILSNEYAIDTQRVAYSLVVNGPFEQTVSVKNPLNPIHLDAGKNDCVNGCSGNGKCNKNGQCECNEQFIGISCNTKVITINDGQTHKDIYPHKKINYFRISPKVSLSNYTFVDFDISCTKSRANIFFCTSTEKSPGKITNAAWDCHESLQSNHSVELSTDPKLKSIYLAIYTSYNEDVEVKLSNIVFTGKERPIQPKSDKNKKILYIAGYVLCGVILLMIAVTIVVVIVKCVRKNKKEPIVELAEPIIATGGPYDVDQSAI